MFNIFADTGVFVLFSHVDSNPFSFENAYFSMHFPLSSTLKRPKTLMDTRFYHRHGFQKPAFLPIHTTNEALSKRCVFKSLHFKERFGKPPFSLAFSIVLVWTREAKTRQKIYFSIRMRVTAVGALASGPMTRADRTRSTSPHSGIYKYVARHSPLYICDTDVGSRWRLRSPVAVDGVLSVNTKKENTS